MTKGSTDLFFGGEKGKVRAKNMEGKEIAKKRREGTPALGSKVAENLNVR